LAEKDDFTAGATSASSRMIHGGLRYMEQGEFRLVRESLRERNRLLQHAPGHVLPLPTTIPLFSRWSGILNAMEKFVRGNSQPSQRGTHLVKLGLSLYDAFSGRDRVLPRHRMASKREALAKRPLLNPAVVGTATYYDAWVAMPERLCLEYLADALSQHAGAVALNYCPAVGISSDGLVQLRKTSPGGGDFLVEPRVVINATGAWIDLTNASLGGKTHSVGGTKGSHLILDHPRLHQELAGEQIFYENEDGRICICFPLFDKVLVGSTDIRIDNPDEAVCTDEEVDYILASVKGVFPALELGREHVVSRYCGVRPLPASETGFTGRISRDHSCRKSPPSEAHPWPVFSLIGGKWTTFQAFAEQVADQVLREIESPRQGFPREQAPAFSPTPDFGNEADLREILTREAVVHLDDFLLRRTPLALCERLSSERFEFLANLAAGALGWDQQRLTQERDRTLEILFRRHGVTLSSSPSSPKS